MNTKISFRHFHNGNDPEGTVRGSAVYATRARLVDLDSGKTLKEAWAYCSPRDNPSRRLGRAIAKARLEKELKGSTTVIGFGGVAFVPRKKESDIAHMFRTCPASSLAELGI